MALRSDRLDAVVNLSKRRGFVYPSSDIYGGLRAAWDYGPLGVELKNNVKRQWWRYMVQERDDIVGLDSSVILAPEVWEASGHVATFTDPLTECQSCHKRFRADHLIEAFEVKHDHVPPGGRRPRRGSSSTTRTCSRPCDGMCRSASARSASRSGTRSRRGTSSSAPASSSRWRWSSSSSPARTRSGTSAGSPTASPGGPGSA